MIRETVELRAIRCLVVRMSLPCTKIGLFAWRSGLQVVRRKTRMNIALDGMLDKYVMIYIDDVIIYSRSWREHLTHIRNVLQRFRDYQLCAKLGKCRFGMTTIKFLGHVISEKGIQPDPDKTMVIDKIQDIKNPKKAKSFLAMVGYYRRFIQDFSKKTCNLWALSNNKGPWNDACQEEMEFLKTCLKKEP